MSLVNNISFSDIERKFLLNKFNGKQEATCWIDLFEKQCTRFKIVDGATKVQVLKLFIDGTVLEWYYSNLMKLSSDWDSWKTSFLIVYGKKSWLSIRTAFNYRYIFGSLIDFVLKKEQ